MNLFDFLWSAVLCGITALLIIPATHDVFITATKSHPYIMGFIKFSMLATMGELLAIRVVSSQWGKTKGFVSKAIIWGLVGILVVFMFDFYLHGVNALCTKGLLYTTSGIVGLVLTAFYISTIMNLTFGIVFMALHRITDTYIDMKADRTDANWSAVIGNIDWVGFVKFVVAKTVPLFWIPAHTITFLLPPEYRVITAAYLSIALGAVLAYARRRPSR